MSRIIAFDMDEVICNIRDASCRAFEAEFGIDTHWAEWDKYNLPGLMNVSTEAYLQMLIKHRVLEGAAVEPGAQAALQLARYEGYSTAIITSRAYHPEAEKATRGWLYRNGIYVDLLHIVDRSKVEAMRELSRAGEVVAYIDDHTRHLQELAGTGLVEDLVLRDRPWNRGLYPWRRAGCLQEFVNFVVRKNKNKKENAHADSVGVSG